MDKFTVACVQMQMRLHASLDDYRDDLHRFLRAADAKRARLILFPEMAGLMIAPLLLVDARSALLRRAEQGRKRSAGAWNKVSGKAAGWLAQALKADLGAATAGLLDVEPQRLWEVYADLFGGLAREQGVTIVAPSAWLPDPAGPADGGADNGTPALRNLSAVFGPTGELLGTQAKVLGASEDEARVGRGGGWRVIPTEVGRVGLLLGSDVLYPEVGRVLAYQNAEVLLLQAACPSPAAYHKLRAGILARMQDNQLYAAASFVVGPNPLRKGSDPYMGRSAILAPQELTPKYNGVLVEMGSAQSEGVVTAEWDYTALKHLWETSDTPLRRALPPEDAAPLLAALFTQLKALPQAPAVGLLPEPAAVPTDEITFDAVPADMQPDDEPVSELDDLPLLGSVRSHWPLRVVDEESGVGEEVVAEVSAQEAPTDVEWTSPRSYVQAESSVTIRRDDETDEMDAVENQLEAVGAQDALPVADALEVKENAPPVADALEVKENAPPVEEDALPVADDVPPDAPMAEAGPTQPTDAESTETEAPPVAAEEPPAPEDE